MLIGPRPSLIARPCFSVRSEVVSECESERVVTGVVD